MLKKKIRDSLLWRVIGKERVLHWWNGPSLNWACDIVHRYLRTRHASWQDAPDQRIQETGMGRVGPFWLQRKR